VGPHALLESDSTGPPRAERLGSRPSQRPRRVVTAAVSHVMLGPHARNPALTTCVAIQHVGERRAHPLPHRDPSANRRAPLCANRLAWSAGGRTWPQPPPERTPQDSGQVRGRRLASPAQPPPLQSRQTRADDRPLADTGGRPRQSRPSQTVGPPRTDALHKAPPVRTGRTRTRDARTRTPHSGHPGTPTPDTGRGQATNGTASIRTSSTATSTKTAAGTANPSCGGRRLRRSNQ
jgi:hypothetical protein